MTIAVTAVALTACTPSGVTGPPTIEPGATDGTVIAITDGDTIVVDADGDEMTIRLAAVNAPERDECYFEEAGAHLVDALMGAEVTLEVTGVDQFDRSLAHVFRDGRHANLDLVAGGFAVASPQEDDPYAGSILDAEEEAFGDAAGLWGAAACGGDGDLPTVRIDPEGSSPDPDGPDEDVLDSEHVLIVNGAQGSVDLSSWTLRDASSRHRLTFGSDTVLAPGDTRVITSADPRWAPGGEPVWSNGGDVALLQDALGNVVSRWRY